MGNEPRASGPGQLGQLLLCRLDRQEKVYLARGVSIGRSADNTFVVDDPQVSRHHAQLEEDPAGGLVLRCMEQAAVLVLEDGRQVRELYPAEGLRFRVGSVEFAFQAAGPERPGPSELSATSPVWLRKCPGCGNGQLPPPRPTPQKCPSCGMGLIVFQTAQAGLACIKASKPLNVLRSGARASEVGSVELGRFVGEGGMGVVFEGRLQPSGTPVALKLLHPHLASQESMVRRFQKEVEILRGLNHPHVVRVIGYGQWDGLKALITEWMPGGSLKTVLEYQRRLGKPLDWGKAGGLLRQAAAALAAVHQAGLIHRDVTPSNFLLSPQGVLKIADLGLAKPTVGRGELTATGLVLGSPNYMAPEHWDGQPDQRSDLFSLGVMFYELLTGRLPQGAWAPPPSSIPRFLGGWTGFWPAC